VPATTIDQGGFDDARISGGNLYTDRYCLITTHDFANMFSAILAIACSMLSNSIIRFSKFVFYVK